MIRIDMSEYQEKHTVSRLIGAPPGYVGYEEAGQLTEAVRRRPYSVVLFDEIEKAHREVLNVMLQLLDDGRLTDGKGRTVDFKNTVVIMTSNVGSHLIAERARSGETTLDEGVRREVMDALRAHFRPEFLNRVDEIIVFHALSREQMRTIIDIQLRGLMKRLEDRKIHVELTDRAKDLVIEEGYDPTYGARPLKRTIQRRSWIRWRCASSRGTSAKGTGSDRRPRRRARFRAGRKHVTPDTRVGHQSPTSKIRRKARISTILKDDRSQDDTVGPTNPSGTTARRRTDPRTPGAPSGTCSVSSSCSRIAQAFFVQLHAARPSPTASSRRWCARTRSRR